MDRVAAVCYWNPLLLSVKASYSRYNRDIKACRYCIGPRQFVNKHSLCRFACDSYLQLIWILPIEIVTKCWEVFKYAAYINLDWQLGLQSPGRNSCCVHVYPGYNLNCLQSLRQPHKNYTNSLDYYRVDGVSDHSISLYRIVVPGFDKHSTN